jgi:RNA polymerase-binding transcription factor DksA
MTPASRASSAGSRTAAKARTTRAAPEAKKATKAPATKAPATKAPATKAPAKKAVAKKAPAKKAVAKKAPAKKAVAKKAPAKKAPAKKAPAKKAPAKKAVAKKAPAKKAPAPKKVPSATAAAPKKAPPVAKAPARAPAKKAAPEKRPTRARAPIGPYASDTKFLEEQRLILNSEGAIYREQATALKAEADSLAQEREPGDVQFDEESGEGGTIAVDRERDLALSAQASLAVEEIEDALVRITRKTYGACERCHQPIMKARLRAHPSARLCVACKSGGLSRR